MDYIQAAPDDDIRSKPGRNTALNRFCNCICLLLALCLIANLLPMSALAAEIQEFPPGESGPDETSAPTVETLPPQTAGETEAAEEAEGTEPAVVETTEESLPDETGPETDASAETEATESVEDPAFFAQSCSMRFGSEVEPQTYTEVPRFYQNDYPDTPYGSDTVATGGCSVTCLAMAASYLLGREYLPDTLADEIQPLGKTNLERMEAGASALGLGFEKAYKWDAVMAALNRSQLVIILLDGDSVFTEEAHTVLLTGLNAYGRIQVNDPNRNNYDSRKLADYFEIGFTEKILSQGFTGCWIFDDTQAAREARAGKPEPSASAHKPASLSAVPLYLQTDYGRIPYNDGTVATSGCALTCLSMVASYLRQEEILPDELVRRFGTYESSNIQRMEAASIVLDLPCVTTTSWWETREALQQGEIAIILLDAKSDFTNVQHMVVATGITEDGNILIHDPNGKSYQKSALKEGFATGFSDEMLQKGFSGAWIYDKYDPPEPRESRYPDFGLTDEERHLIASVIWLEARGESFQGQQAVAEIVFNRLASGKFSKTVRGTILAEGQFRTAKFLDDAKPGELQYKAIEAALNGPNVLPENVYFFGRNPTNPNVWGRIGRHVFCGSY